MVIREAGELTRKEGASMNEVIYTADHTQQFPGLMGIPDHGSLFH